MNHTQRNQLLDVLRGIVILVVIFGHALQGACHGQSGATGLHRFIMSFQMEIFFSISGFAMAYSKSPSLIEALNKRFRRLGIPYLSWVILFYLAEVVLHVKPLTIASLSRTILTSGFWFLRELFILCLILELVRHVKFQPHWFFKALCPVVVLLLTSIIPGQDRLLHFSVYFFTGYALRASIDHPKDSAIRKQNSAHSSIMMALCWCGKNSLALYAIHWNVFFVFMSLYAVDFSTLINKGLNVYLLSFSLFCTYLFGSILLIKIINRIPVLNKILY